VIIKKNNELDLSKKIDREIKETEESIKEEVKKKVETRMKESEEADREKSRDKIKSGEELDIW
jgi:hypothetical protein